ncbi:MAG: M23 family metallopeptidase, partial [Micrococcales bacterium]|nr:M23 family metallopeptidase [Micrococcales bacterium]
MHPRPSVQRPFVPPASTWGAGHRGLDLAAHGGDRVLAVEAGVVTHVGVVAGRGTVTVRHPDGLRSTYEPVRASVTLGEPVAAGSLLGVVEAPAAWSTAHCPTARCLHLGARRGEVYLDPLPLLTGLGRVRL